MIQPLTTRQEAIITYIAHQIAQQGYAPSVREIGAAVGISSSSTVHAELRRLEELAVLRRDPAKPRAMVIQWPEAENRGFTQPPDNKPFNSDFPGLRKDSEATVLPAGYEAVSQLSLTELGQADLNPTTATALPWLIPQSLWGTGAHVLAEMPDDSLINRQIYPGDLLILERKTMDDIVNGDIVAFALAGTILLRTYYKGLRQIRLQGENDRLEPLMVEPAEFTAIAKLVGVVRRFESE